MTAQSDPTGVLAISMPNEAPSKNDGKQKFIKGENLESVHAL